jgi:D-arabinose 1-dehydrogenase-like Zn-dependent alcohol dehydrogenase
MAAAVRKAMKEQAEKRVPERAAPAEALELRSTRVHRGRDAQPAAPRPGEIFVRVQGRGVDPADQTVSAAAASQVAADGAPDTRGMDAAGSVIAAGEGVTRFAVGDDVFGHFPAGSWAWVQAPCARLTADGPHVERRPEGLGPLAAAALARSGLIAKTILRAADPRPGQTALVVGADLGPGALLLSLLAETGARVIAGATPEDDGDVVRSLGAAETFPCATADPVADALARHPDVDLLVDLVTFGEPYFITAGARCGTIVADLPELGAGTPYAPRVGISAEPGDLAALAQRALDGRQPIDIADVYRLEEAGQALPGIGGKGARRALAAGA